MIEDSSPNMRPFLIDEIRCVKKEVIHLDVIPAPLSGAAVSV
jgi:hypothetical protein